MHYLAKKNLNKKKKYSNRALLKKFKEDVSTKLFSPPRDGFTKTMQLNLNLSDSLEDFLKKDENRESLIKTYNVLKGTRVGSIYYLISAIHLCGFRLFDNGEKASAFRAKNNIREPEKTKKNRTLEFAQRDIKILEEHLNYSSTKAKELLEELDGISYHRHSALSLIAWKIREEEREKGLFGFDLNSKTFTKQVQNLFFNSKDISGSPNAISYLLGSLLKDYFFKKPSLEDFMREFSIEAHYKPYAELVYEAFNSISENFLDEENKHYADYRQSSVSGQIDSWVNNYIQRIEDLIILPREFREERESLQALNEYLRKFLERELFNLEDFKNFKDDLKSFVKTLSPKKHFKNNLANINKALDTCIKKREKNPQLSEKKLLDAALSSLEKVYFNIYYKVENNFNLLKEAIENSLKDLEKIEESDFNLDFLSNQSLKLYSKSMLERGLRELLNSLIQADESLKKALGLGGILFRDDIVRLNDFYASYRERIATVKTYKNIILQNLEAYNICDEERNKEEEYKEYKKALENIKNKLNIKGKKDKKLKENNIFNYEKDVLKFPLIGGDKRLSFKEQIENDAINLNKVFSLRETLLEKLKPNFQLKALSEQCEKFKKEREKFEKNSREVLIEEKEQTFRYFLNKIFYLAQSAGLEPKELYLKFLKGQKILKDEKNVNLFIINLKGKIYKSYYITKYSHDSYSLSQNFIAQNLDFYEKSLDTFFLSIHEEFKRLIKTQLSAEPSILRDWHKFLNVYYSYLLLKLEREGEYFKNDEDFKNLYEILKGENILPLSLRTKYENTNSYNREELIKFFNLINAYLTRYNKKIAFKEINFTFNFPSKDGCKEDIDYVPGVKELKLPLFIRESEKIKRALELLGISESEALKPSKLYKAYKKIKTKLEGEINLLNAHIKEIEKRHKNILKEAKEKGVDKDNFKELESQLKKERKDLKIAQNEAGLQLKQEELRQVKNILIQAPHDFCLKGKSFINRREFKGENFVIKTGAKKYKGILNKAFIGDNVEINNFSLGFTFRCENSISFTGSEIEANLSDVKDVKISFNLPFKTSLVKTSLENAKEKTALNPNKFLAIDLGEYGFGYALFNFDENEHLKQDGTGRIEDIAPYKFGFERVREIVNLKNTIQKYRRVVQKQGDYNSVSNKRLEKTKEAIIGRLKNKITYLMRKHKAFPIFESSVDNFERGGKQLETIYKSIISYYCYIDKNDARNALRNNYWLKDMKNYEHPFFEKIASDEDKEKDKLKLYPGTRVNPRYTSYICSSCQRNVREFSLEELKKKIQSAEIALEKKLSLSYMLENFTARTILEKLSQVFPEEYLKDKDIVKILKNLEGGKLVKALKKKDDIESFSREFDKLLNNFSAIALEKKLSLRSMFENLSANDILEQLREVFPEKYLRGKEIIESLKELEDKKVSKDKQDQYKREIEDLFDNFLPNKEKIYLEDLYVFLYKKLFLSCIFENLSVKTILEKLSQVFPEEYLKGKKIVNILKNLKGEKLVKALNKKDYRENFSSSVDELFDNFSAIALEKKLCLSSIIENFTSNDILVQLRAIFPEKYLEGDLRKILKHWADREENFKIKTKKLFNNFSINIESREKGREHFYLPLKAYFYQKITSDELINDNYKALVKKSIRRDSIILSAYDSTQSRFYCPFTDCQNHKKTYKYEMGPFSFSLVNGVHADKNAAINIGRRFFKENVKYVDKS